jgi:hypothetical protein
MYDYQQELGKLRLLSVVTHWVSFGGLFFLQPYFTYSLFTPGSRVSLGYMRFLCSTLGWHLSLLSCCLSKALLLYL